jgi:signal transduction histidine kinase
LNLEEASESFLASRTHLCEPEITRRTGEGVAVSVSSTASRGVGFDQLALDTELRDSAFGAVPERSDLAVVAVSFAAAAVAVAIVATGNVVSEPSLFAAVLVANIVTLGLGGLVWRRGRPSSLFGNLLLAEGVLVAVSCLSGSPSPGLYLVGMLAVWASALGATWLLLVFPGSRLDGAARVVMGLGLATFLVGELPLLLVSPNVVGLTGIRNCAGACPANAALAVDAPGAADTFRHIEGALQLAWGVGLLVYLATRFLWASHARRRLLLPVFLTAAPFVVAFALNAALFDLAGVQPTDTARAIFAGTRILLPLGFLAGLLFARAYAGEALAFMARKLVGRPPIAAVEQLVRRVLDDPQARLVFWLPRSEQFVDRHGMAVVLDPAFEGITWRGFGHGEAKVLAIVHDDVLSEDPELLEAVGAASLLTLENRRLEHDLLDSVDALRASQRRLVGAASAERRKIERDLHDGVQQKLVALRIELELARDLGDSAGLERRLEELAADFDEALDDLRSTAHGIYPPLLADEGLGAALREVARRSPVPLTVDLEDVGRLSEECETAIYYCCLEALQNVAKHGGDGAAAKLRLCRDRNSVRFSVTDDGVGFVTRGQAAGGAGLTNMTDRIGAVGGTLAVRSSPGDGTTVLGTVIEAGDRIGYAAHV